VNRAARVIPDVATFAVDDGFWYSIPEHLVADLHLGSIVRVPLSGRRVRGWVVELAGEREGKLKDVSGISGSTQVFDHDLLKSLLWAAHHYVTPMAVMLSRATPPNLPRRLPAPVPVPNVAGSPHALDDAVGRAAAGLTSPTTALVANWHGMEWVSSLGPLLAIGRSVLVIAASVLEVEALQEKARSVWGDVVVTVSGSDDASDTAAWESAQTAPRRR
jgi:primosomal protein N'